MASIAFTGARGRLGRWFLSNPEWSDLHELTGFSRTADASLQDLDDLDDSGILGEFDLLVHLAWSSVPRTAEEDPGAWRENDLPRLQSFLDRIAEIEPDRRPHLVFFSTGAVYGNAPHDSESVENDLPAPIGDYARGKHAAEKLILKRAEAFGLPATVLRVSNAWGFPGTGGPPQGVIPILVQAALRGSTFELWGGNSEKDYLHIDDLSRALLAIAGQPPMGLYNIARGRSHRLGEIIEIVENLTGRAINTVPGGSIDWDVSRNRISPAKFIRETGWQPRVELREGIERLITEMG